MRSSHVVTGRKRSDSAAVGVMNRSKVTEKGTLCITWRHICVFSAVNRKLWPMMNTIWTGSLPSAMASFTSDPWVAPRMGNSRAP